MHISEHEHHHAPNRFAVIPNQQRLDADPSFTGRGVTIAFLDSGFYPHPDLVEPSNRIAAYEDVTGEYPTLSDGVSESWQWHGTQTSVAAAGNGNLCGGAYRGLASDGELVLVKVSHSGHITEDNIAQGIDWVIRNRERYNIRVLNISLGGDQDVPCSKSIIDQAAEEAIKQGIVVVAAAGNSGHEGKHSIPPANSPSVITVGGYTDNNHLDRHALDLYQSNFGFTADGTLKPEVIAPAMWVAAPILPGTPNYRRAEALSQLVAAFDYELPRLARTLREQALLPESLLTDDATTLRAFIESVLRQNRIVATHYQHVDGTSFAAPIVTSLVAQMIEANPGLTPVTVKNILISTAERISTLPVIRQGYGVINARRAVQVALSETHNLESSGCELLKSHDGRVRFAYHNDTARSVSLAGDFNSWDHTTNQLMRDESGLWRVEIPAPARGRYQYKFVVNAKDWVEDPNNGFKTPDNYGGLNSVLIVD
jgi:serine protease AprX